MSDDGSNNANESANSAGSDSTSGDNKSSQNSNQDAGNTSGSTNSDAGGDDKGTKTTETQETVSKSDYDALFNRMQAADRRATALEKKQKDQDDKDLSEAEKAKKDAAEAKAESERLKAEVRDAKIQNAFLAIKDVAWHDVDDAYTMLKNNYMDGVDVDSNGKVTGIDPAVKKLAKEKAYLVKVATDNADSTGAAHNGQRKGDQKDTSKEQRISRFPAAYGPR